MIDSKKLFKFRFFKTRKEKVFLIRELKKGNPLPLFLYCLYLLRMSSFVIIERKYYKIHLHYAPYALWLYFHKHKKRKEEEFVHFYLDEGNTFVDCGAHLGTVSLTASKRVGKSGKVISIEAHPKTFSFLMENIKLAPFENITMLHAAVLDKEGDTFISSDYVSDMNHVGSIGEKVKAVTLSKILTPYKNITLLKVDVEGAEFKALLGLQSDIVKVDAILFESAGASFERYGYSLKDVMHFLIKNGFTIYRFPNDSEKELQRVEMTYETKVRYEDLLALSQAGRIRFQKKQGKILLA